ncbi:hypothetical protein F4806DRAFT_455695 [Annulohypoxylon nitens]|nr:hypothetical protein F4806DRAFT_455695 [Annulohypoxylon nitens]
MPFISLSDLRLPMSRILQFSRMAHLWLGVSMLPYVFGDSFVRRIKCRVPYPGCPREILFHGTKYPINCFRAIDSRYLILRK